MYERKIGSAEGKKEWATTHFWSSVAIENPLSRQRILVLYCDRESSIATKNSGSLLRQEVLVGTGSPGCAHNTAWVRATTRNACDKAEPVSQHNPLISAQIVLF